MDNYNDMELEHAKKGLFRSAAEGLANAGASFHRTMYNNDQTKNKKTNVDTRQALADEQLKNAKLQKESKMKRDEEILAALTSSVSQFLRGDNVITPNEDKQIRDILRNTNYTDYVINPNGKSIIFISKSFPNKTFTL